MRLHVEHGSVAGPCQIQPRGFDATLVSDYPPRRFEPSSWFSSQVKSAHSERARGEELGVVVLAVSVVGGELLGAGSLLNLRSDPHERVEPVGGVALVSFRSLKRPDDAFIDACLFPWGEPAKLGDGLGQCFPVLAQKNMRVCLGG